MTTSLTSKLRAPVIALALLSLTACSGMNSTQQRTLSGAGIGAGVGAVGTAVTGGCVGCGAAIGAGVGAVGGYLYDKNHE
ncbi:MAG TPA: YMGG-like glycine zipper-containing protein [Patescibacteria group bacterium]|nr:YMGG-like glycine zipper-containing protein [Patescibacteria group bacterium]